MAVYNNTVTNLYYDSMDKSKNKVYINPNFNRLPGDYTSNSAMHVNPKFSHLLSNVQPNINKPKIYVNPNFVKSRNCVEDTHTTFNTNSSSFQESAHLYGYVSYQPNDVVTEQERLASLPISKSRYCLVRQNTTKVLERPDIDKSKTTIQVTKYKSIPLKDIKRNLDGIKNTRPIIASTSRKSTDLSSCNASTKSQYKFLNSTLRRSFSNNKITTIISNEMHRKNVLTKLKPRKVKRNLKKNNIPCPMFRKFGKCLRQTRGNCEFLHDKKHVIICRNFLKGLCHDKACLLSHELTTKKMPTCYFYLQGTCNKSDCPYLHVKLSEKVKICPDFLKGYCEKGDQCLQRHVNVNRDKGNHVSMKSSKVLKRKFFKIKENRLEQNSTKETKITENPGTITEKQTNNLDCRYYEEYKDEVNATETCEIIKPMRCKLGTLPDRKSVV